MADIGQGIEDKVLEAVVLQAWSKKLATPVVELEIPLFYGLQSIGSLEDEIL